MTKKNYLSIFLFLILACQAIAQTTDALRQKIQQIVSSKRATVGVSIMGNDGKDTVSLCGDCHLPMQSVFKYHIGLAVLSEIDKGKYALDQKVALQKKDLLPDLWSPLREENPNGGSFPISTLIKYAVSWSDNVACDALLRLLGGPKVVEDYFLKNNIKDLSIKINEETMQADRKNMFLNWTTPKAANEALAKFYYNKNKLLSRKSYTFIWKVMKGTETGKNRLKGQLPRATIVAHKTGSSGTSKAGVTEAINDIGVVFLPNGKHFFISVFVTNSMENEETNEKIIADIAKAAWDYFTKN
jgi:beta-lactamase class A